LDAAVSGAGKFGAAVVDRALVFLKGKSSGRSGCRHHKITASAIAIWMIGEIVSRMLSTATEN
jgi:hypothetical protein